MLVRWWICSHETELLQWTELLFSFQGYLHFTYIWACTTNRKSGGKDGQILPWSQDLLCSEGGERWESWTRKKYAQDTGLRGEYHPVSHTWSGVNFGFLVLLRVFFVKCQFFLASQVLFGAVVKKSPSLSLSGVLKKFNLIFGISNILRFTFHWRIHLFPEGSGGVRGQSLQRN